MAESDTIVDEHFIQPVKAPFQVRLEEAIAAGAMALLCVITMANVVVRYLTNISFAFTEEISVWLMVVMTLVGASGAFVKGHHISINFLVDRMKPATRWRVRLSGLLASTVMFATLAVFGVRMAYEDFRYDVTSPALDVPQWLYTVWLPVLSLLIVVRLVQLVFVFLKQKAV
ncbi:MAG: TRAP transporter small permease [Proteobacteria bacterium]|nr:TRAP transporter small permease [Pseudomonadota bacterium]